MGQNTNRGYKLDQSGQEVQDLLDKIDELDAVTQDKDGLMVAKDKELLDNHLTHHEINELLNFELKDEPLTHPEIDELLNF